MKSDIKFSLPHFSWPAWLPMAPTIVGAVLAIAFAAAAGTFMLLARGAEHDLAFVKDEIAAHRELSPLVETVTKRLTETNALSGKTVDKQSPVGVRETVLRLEKLAADAGLVNAEFAPDALSSVGRSTIRLLCRAAGPTDAFRALTATLADQSWVEKIETVKATAAVPVNTIELRIVVRILKEGH